MKASTFSNQLKSSAEMPRSIPFGASTNPSLPKMLFRMRIFGVVAGFALLILLGKGFLTITGRQPEDTAQASVVNADALKNLSPEAKTKIQEQLKAHGLLADLDHIQDLPTPVQSKIAEALKSLKAQDSLAVKAEDAKARAGVRDNANPSSALPSTQPSITAEPKMADKAMKDGFDPLRLTSHEVQVLETLSKRRKTLNQREKELHFKSALLTASEERIDKKINELKVLQKGVATLLQAYRTQDDENIKSLAKIYESMKPREAARILSDLETPVLLKVITHMREMRSSAILANMVTEKARDVTLALARDHKLMDDTQKQLSDMRQLLGNASHATLPELSEMISQGSQKAPQPVSQQSSALPPKPLQSSPAMLQTNKVTEVALPRPAAAQALKPTEVAQSSVGGTSPAMSSAMPPAPSVRP